MSQSSSLSRRSFLKSTALGAAAVSTGLAACTAQNSKASTPKPNILMILVDDLGYGDLGAMGAKDMRTPHIDALYTDGIRFDTFYANCPVCSPTRASLLTGRYPDLVGVPGVIRTHADDSWGFLNPNAVLIPQMLKKADYHTAIVGKWHLGLKSPSTPNERGFDHFHGFLGDMMDDYYTHLRYGNNYMRLNDKEIDPKGHASDLFSDWSADYIKSRAETDNPFFLYLAYNAPHTPIQPPKDWVTRVREREPQMDAKRVKLVALIEHLDAGIGRVVQALKETGQYNNTLIVFTSDNGGRVDLGANHLHLRGAKQNMYEGGIREPMCAVWKDKIKPGSSGNGVALTMDLFPTFCEAAGVPLTHEIEGKSMLNALLGKEDAGDPDRVIFWVRREGNNRYRGSDYYAARRGPWKLLANNPFEPYVLFNLDDDPSEQHPITDDQHPQYQFLLKALMLHIQKAGRIPWQQ